jgi:hyperosmotically inducible periplasmic protein
MNFSKHFVIGSVVAASFAAGGAQGAYAEQTTPKTRVVVDDSTLKTRVETAIKAQPTLKAQDVDVKVDNRVVTLTGSVDTEQHKLRAGRTANVSGVARVDNQLMVSPNAHKDVADKAADATKTAAHKTGEATKVAAEKTGDAAKVVGEKTKDAAVATGEVITDAWINTRIHSKMVDEATLKGSDVSVDVEDHVVMLKGTVVSAAGKARAEEIAQTTDGVKSVHNMLTIGPKK